MAKVKKDLKWLAKNVTLDNAYYVAQSLERSLTWTEEQKEAIRKQKIEKCPDCWDNMECLECGCNTREMFISDKPCPLKRF